MNRYKYETAASFVLWTGAVFYSIYGVVKTKAAFNNFQDIYGDFREGWLVTATKKDSADIEWETGLHILFQSYPWVIAQIVISECLRRKYCKILPYWQLLVATSFILYNIGLVGIVIATAQPILFECIYKFRSKFLIWICAGVCLVLIYHLKTLNFTDSRIRIELNETQHYMIVVATCWINLRCISYYLDNLTTKHSILDVLSYCFYLPTLFLGPFIPYAEFEKAKKYYGISLQERISELFQNTVRFGFWIIFTEFSLHYVYINALSYQPELVKSLDSWTLYGYGYCMGQFFHLKYVVLYGLSTSFTKFEHIETPPIPKCIGRIHLYSDMWKYFDRGLYKFLIRHIYLPSLKGGIIRSKMFSSFLCFLFVYVWHGIQYHILVWATLNFIGVSIENLFENAYNSLQWNFIQLSEQWKLRLLCIIASPLLAVSAISNFYFFAGMEIGSIFIDRFVNGFFSTNMVLLFFLSCCCCASTEVKRWEKCSQKGTKSVH